VNIEIGGLWLGDTEHILTGLVKPGFPKGEQSGRWLEVETDFTDCFTGVYCSYSGKEDNLVDAEG